MAIKWEASKVTEIKGVIYVQKVVNDAKCIFNKIDGTNDFGLDGYIEFTQNNSPTGLCVAVQIKSGNSNKLKSKPFVVAKADRNHFELWSNHILPVVGIVYLPEEDLAYWIDITQYLNNNEDFIESGPYAIQISKDNIFNIENFQTFHRNLLKYQAVYGSDRYFGKALRTLTDLSLPEHRYDAIKSLFSFHRDKKETWYFLITHFCFEANHEVQNALLYGYRHLLNHGDIWWHPGNIVIDEIRLYV